MFSAAPIVDSMRVGTRLGDLNIVVRGLYRFQPGGTTADQRRSWSVLECDVSDDDAPDLADAFASVLSQPGWQVDFRSPAESFVVFPGRVFRYPKGLPCRGAGAWPVSRRP